MLVKRGQHSRQAIEVDRSNFTPTQGNAKDWLTSGRTGTTFPGNPVISGDVRVREEEGPWERCPR